MYLELDPALKAALPEDTNTFEWFLHAKGTTHREVKHRLTYETRLGEHHIFVKRHLGCGWREVLKEWYRLRKPVVSARTEWEGAAILAAAGVRVPKVLGKGERGRYPHAIESFVVLDALEDCETLEHFKHGWIGLFRPALGHTQTRPHRRSRANRPHDARPRHQPPRLLHQPLPDQPRSDPQLATRPSDSAQPDRLTPRATPPARAAALAN